MTSGGWARRCTGRNGLVLVNRLLEAWGQTPGPACGQRRRLTWDIAGQTSTTNHVSHENITGTQVLPGYLLSHLFSVSKPAQKAPLLLPGLVAYHTPPMPSFFSYTTRSIFLSRSGILIAAHIPENPAPTTRTFSRLRFSTGSSLSENEVVPLVVVFPSEPAEWAISPAGSYCLWMT